MNTKGGCNQLSSHWELYSEDTEWAGAMIADDWETSSKAPVSSGREMIRGPFRGRERGLGGAQRPECILLEDTRKAGFSWVSEGEWRQSEQESPQVSCEQETQRCYTGHGTQEEVTVASDLSKWIKVRFLETEGKTQWGLTPESVGIRRGDRYRRRHINI